jgi:hypothetical protein
MTARACMLVAGVMVAGCNAAPVQLTVGSQTLTVHDQGYYHTDGVDYCNAGAPGQTMLDFVDYNFICDPRNQPQRDPAVQHLELQIVLSMNNPQRDPYMPYTVGMADCTNGPTMEAIARFLHYPANASKPDTTVQANSGTVQFTATPTDKGKPWVGTMDLVFGSQHVKQAFSIYACN